MRFLILVPCLFLGGCWFVFIPGSAISSLSDGLSGQFGNMCIGESSKPGDKIKHTDGRIGTVQKVSGPSSRCNTTYPVRAEVTFE